MHRIILNFIYLFSFKIVTRKEIRPFRLLLKSKKNLKRCGKRIQLHCDYDEDGSITETEWNMCIGVKKGKFCVLYRFAMSLTLYLLNQKMRPIILH